MRLHMHRLVHVERRAGKRGFDGTQSPANPDALRACVHTAAAKAGSGFGSDYALNAS